MFCGAHTNWKQNQTVVLCTKAVCMCVGKGCKWFLRAHKMQPQVPSISFFCFLPKLHPAALPEHAQETMMVELAYCRLCSYVDCCS